jgi:hypothetical protein
MRTKNEHAIQTDRTRFRRPGETIRVERQRNLPLLPRSPVGGRGSPAELGRETPGIWRGEGSMMPPRWCRSKSACPAAQRLSRADLNDPHPQPTLTVRRRDASISLTKLRQKCDATAPKWDFDAHLSILCELSNRLKMIGFSVREVAVPGLDWVI